MLMNPPRLHNRDTIYTDEHLEIHKHSAQMSQGQRAAGSIRSTEKSDEPTGNLTHDLPACIKCLKQLHYPVPQSIEMKRKKSLYLHFP
jgi:hypothetical protein